MANTQDRVQLIARVPPEIRDEIKILAIRRKRLVQDEVEEALRAHLAHAREAVQQQGS
jgi:hypothetical protein